jgi:tetratricopeptide (TPR) repeat protein
MIIHGKTYHKLKNTLLLPTLQNHINMKISTIIKGLIFILILQSCSGGLGTTKTPDAGETAYQAGNYEEALNTWEQSIISRESKGKKAKAPIYVGAGKSALALEQIDKARKYLETAKGLEYTSPELYSSLAKVYKIIDNLSKEITALELYRKNYPQGEDINSITIRLFETYVESMNWDLGKDLWPVLETQAQSDASLLAGYLTINKNLENTAACDKLAQQIFKLEKSNITALEYYAEKYFWKAENIYTVEMKAYKNNRTTSQYNKLLKALEVVWPNFKKSRDYFLKLYKIDPKPEYAKYLAKIYTRYDDKEKAAYYNKRAK